MKLLGFLYPFILGAGLIGGDVVDKGKWPEIVRIKSLEKNSYCTATLVGPRALLTAAHCTTPDGIVVPVSWQQTYSFTVTGSDYSAICTVAPDYKERVGDQDMALCLTDREVTGVRFASIAKQGPVKDEVITLTGYGCIQPGGSGGNDGKLRIGEALVFATSTTYNYSFYTFGEAAICYGDSGGPALKRVTKTHPNLLVVYGVNSRGNIKDTSLVTDLNHPNSRTFVRNWELENNTSICGVSRDCTDKPKPPNTCGDVLVRFQELVLDLAQCLAID